MQYLRKIHVHPSIGRLPAALLTLFFATVTIISVRFSTTSVSAGPEHPAPSSNVIPPEWGMTAFTSVLLLCLAKAAFDIIGQNKLIKDGSFKLARVIKIVTFPFTVLSILWSVVDWLLVNVFANFLGMKIAEPKIRYMAFFLVCVFLLTASQITPTPWSFVSIGLLVVCLIGLLRRWSWVEHDRDAFVLERGAEHSERVFRIGFENDLRDEALIAIAIIMLVLPFCFSTLQEWSCSSSIYGCAYLFDADTEQGTFAVILKWIGFFGAELLKTLPFVDWSEVFNVANGSPIEVRSPLGAQFLFWVRASLDLLFLATVFQVFQLGVRNREQLEAFKAGRIPVLEPFTERLELKLANERHRRFFGVATSQSEAVTKFPTYDKKRLTEIVANLEGRWDYSLRTFAAAVLQQQYPDQDTGKFFNDLLSGRSQIEAEMKAELEFVASAIPAASNDIRVLRAQDCFDVIQQTPFENIDHKNAIISIIGMSKNDPSTELLERIVNDSYLPHPTRASCFAAMSENMRACDNRVLRDLIRDGFQDRSYRNPHSYISLGRAGRFSPEKLRDLDFLPLELRDALALGSRLMPVQEASQPIGDALNPLVSIPPNHDGSSLSFFMGATPGDTLAYQAEHPRHLVTLPGRFCIGRTAVTRGLYELFRSETLMGGWTLPASDLPAIGVSWFDAVDFCRWLTIVSGVFLRLPTEEEWEFACRSGADMPYPWGNDWEPRFGNCNDGEAGGICPVDSYPPNGYGLFGMNGNTYEWCLDPWHPDYAEKPDLVGKPWISDGDYEHRVVRGGSWDYGPQDSRSSYRYRTFPSNQTDIMGLRVIAPQVPTL